MCEARSHWAVGQIVRHLKFGYRGVIFDIDSTFQGTALWYERVARSRPPKDRPWYHVLVDESDQVTYVAERHLASDPSGEPVRHPLLDHFFEEFREGLYRQHRPFH